MAGPYFTKRGINLLRRKIHILETELERLQSQVGDAAETGGNQWHDNASYEALVIDIRGVDRQLSDAHKLLNQADVVGPPHDAHGIDIGIEATISVDGQEKTVIIGGHGESDPDGGILAYDAPMGNVLLGKGAGETAILQIGGRKVHIGIKKTAIAEKYLRDEG